MSEKRKIYFSGIGGIGVSAMAKLFLNQAKEVRGSDLVQSENTEELVSLGIKVLYEQKAENITKDIELFIYSSAISENHPERLRASELGIKQMSYVEVLGNLSRSHKTFAVSGTNGKSTTTAMIASILVNAELDPTVIVGSKLKQIEGNFRAGKSEYFLVEACEYRDNFLNLSPHSIILTNIEADHLDYFKDLNQIINSFQQYVNKLNQPENILVVNNDDVNTMQLSLPDCKIISYGINETADVMARDWRVEKGKQYFNIEFRGKNLGEFTLQIPGKFNVFNALAAIAFSLSQNIDVEIIKESLKNFSGIWRRFEKIKDAEIVVVSDYAHHPTAVKNTIRAAKEFYPNQRVIALFQPHQHNRTKNLFNDFVSSLYEADIIIMPEIFDVRGREESKDLTVSSKDLADEIKKNWPDKKVMYAKNLEQALDLVNFNLEKGDVVLVMGAGDVYKICNSITFKSTNIG